MQRPTADGPEWDSAAGLRYNMAKMHDDAQLKILRAMTPEQKLKVAQRLWDSAWQLKAAAVRTDHPEWTEEQVQRAVRDAFLYARD